MNVNNILTTLSITNFCYNEIVCLMIPQLSKQTAHAELKEIYESHIHEGREKGSLSKKSV